MTLNIADPNWFLCAVLVFIGSIAELTATGRRSDTYKLTFFASAALIGLGLALFVPRQLNPVVVPSVFAATLSRLLGNIAERVTAGRWTDENEIEIKQWWEENGHEVRARARR